MLRMTRIIVAEHRGPEDCFEKFHNCVIGKEISVANNPILQFLGSCRVIVFDQQRSLQNLLHVIQCCCEQVFIQVQKTRMTRASLPTSEEIAELGSN